MALGKVNLFNNISNVINSLPRVSFLSNPPIVLYLTVKSPSVYSELISHRPCAQGLIFAKGGENWLLALRPSDWQSIHIIATLHLDWKAMLKLMWSSKMTNLSICQTQLEGFDICLAFSFSNNLL